MPGTLYRSRGIAGLMLLSAPAIGWAQAPVIDGKLDDIFWKRVAAQKLEPAEEGVPVSGGEVRMIVRGRHLLIAARLPEPTGRIVARVMGRHPNWEDEDMLEVTAGPDIGYTDRVVRINPFGAFTVEREGQAVHANADRYLIAASVANREWIVEAAFPLNEVSAPGPEPVLASVRRIRAMRQGSPRQRWRWPRYDPAVKIAVDRSAPWESPAPEYRPAPMGNQEPALKAGRAAIPPLDTAWDDPRWARTPIWLLRRNEPGMPPPRLKTEVKALQDGKTLAVFARCEESGDVVTQVNEHDGRIERDDSFHVYLGVSGSSYAQIAVSAAGHTLDLAGKTGGPRISRPRTDWESGARTSVRREGNAWTARLDIPIEPALNILGEPGSTTDLRILLVRVRPGRSGAIPETSTLSLVPGQTFHAPIRYRRLTLLNEPLFETHVAGATPPPENLRVWTAEDRSRLKPAEMLYKHIRTRVDRAVEAEAAAWAAVRTREEWEQFRSKRLKALADFIGPFPDRVALQPVTGKEYRGEGYRRLDIAYRSRQDLWITANLYLPERASGRVPAFVIVPSHHRPRTQAELQDMGILWARTGSIVLIADNLGHGERIQTYPWNREGYHARYNLGLQLYAAGESLMGWMVWDIMRSVDLLVERSDVDAGRIILLGAVAGGGDPAAVAAALDPRVAAVAPFNFGEATPEKGGRAAGPVHLADPGWGSWETTRNLPRSIADQFLPWFICASVAPRRFVFSYEMGWEIEKQPILQRYRKVFDLYGSLDHLDEAHGFGGFPGPGECSNIGPSQRQTLYPELQRWFQIPPPAKEPDDRRPEEELLAFTPALAAKYPSRPVHQLAGELGRLRLAKARQTLAALDPAARLNWLRREWSARLGDTEPGGSPVSTSARTWNESGVQTQLISLEVEPGIHVPLALMKSASASGPVPVVVGFSHGGKEYFWRDHRAEIERLIARGIAVCLPDVRGVGETSPDGRRGPMSAEVSLAATELMLGGSLLAGRIKDVRSVLAYLRTRPGIDRNRIAIWGDSDAPANPPRLLLDESPGWQIGPDVQLEADPLGGLLALFTALYEPGVRVAAMRRGLIGFESILEDTFAYVPGHVIVPDMLSAGDLPDIVGALPSTALWMESPVDARNRVLPQVELQARFPDTKAVLRAAAPQSLLADWLIARL